MLFLKKIIPTLFLIVAFCITASTQTHECVQGDCENGNGTMRFESGTVYKGAFKKGQFHGFGICRYSDGDMYEGWWVERFPDGMGTLSRKSDGKVISGLWRKGLLIDSAGEVLDVDFVEKAVEEGQLQIGCLSGNCVDGNGVKAYPDGTKYEGEFKEGKYHGKGSLFYTNGDVFEGIWELNYQHGEGIIFHNDKTVTKGIWENGDFLGEGKGEVTKDCAKIPCINEGQAFYTYGDGTSYLGEIKEGVPKGWGRVQYLSGEVYEGDWENNQPNGFGTFKDKEGNEFKGIWKDSKLLKDEETLAKEMEKDKVFEEEQPVNYKDKKTKIWAVVVGVSSYSHMRPLRYSDNDAFRLMAFLKSPEGGALSDDQMRVLVDEDATKESILSSMEEMYGKAGPNDLVILYFSGHGLRGSFLPIDYDGVDNKLYHKEINEILNKSKAKYKLCVADACHSGSYNFVSKGADDVEGMLNDYYSNLAESSPGTALILSSKPEETSLESRKVRQGVFSHYLLRGLQGEANVNGDNVVSIQELYDFINVNVKEYTRYRQSPIIQGNYDVEMPVSVVREKE